MSGETYADLLRGAMRGLSKGRSRYGIAQLAGAAGYSYEHVRKILSGEPVGSKELNAALCAALRLDPDSMWVLATREKLSRKYGDLGEPGPPPDTRFKALWPRLSHDEKKRLLRLAQAFVQARAR